MASLIVLIPTGCGLIAGAVMGSIAGAFSLDTFSWWLLTYGGSTFVVGSFLYYLYRRKHPYRDPLDGIFEIAFVFTGVAFAVGYGGMFGKVKLTNYLYHRFIQGIVQEEIRHLS